MIRTNLFEFAFVPSWYDQLDNLSIMALPEPWKFKVPRPDVKNTQTPILERYLHMIFQKAALDYCYADNEREADLAFYIRNEIACFHTGLYTSRYTSIYAFFERNKRKDSLLDWYFRGFVEETSPWLKYIEPLPIRPFCITKSPRTCFYPDWSIRVNVLHMIGDYDNLERIPPDIREMRNLPLLLEASVELGRRKAIYSPGIVAPQVYGGSIQFLLPICLTNMDVPDLAMTLTPMDGYYTGATCLTLEMAYLNARLIEKPTAPWLLVLVT